MTDIIYEVEKEMADGTVKIILDDSEDVELGEVKLFNDNGKTYRGLVVAFSFGGAVLLRPL